MKRREFITLLGGMAAAWPRAARAQQPVPVIGFLNRPIRQPAFVGALREHGFVEGSTIEFDFRWGSFDDQPALATELVRRRVALIRPNGPSATRAAMAATATIPIVFSMGEDPVKEGIVANLNRPGGNVTGFSSFSNQLVAKRLDLLRELLPKVTTYGFLANQTNPNFNADTTEVRAASDALGLRLYVVTASTERELHAAFDSMVRNGISALLVGVDFWFREQVELINALAARYRIPASYEGRTFAEAGGLMSYGSDDNDRQRQLGLYAARILKGAKPADLPIQQASKFEFILNFKTAKALGLNIPLPLRALATEVIE
jgi:putative tryptophan/tyrosine transport system substrate-binding protein